jgi:hypothetical protein
MVNPRPVPPYLLVVEPSAWENGAKINFCFSIGIPIPVSDTAKRKTHNALLAFHGLDLSLERNLTTTLASQDAVSGPRASADPNFPSACGRVVVQLRPKLKGSFSSAAISACWR